MYTVHFEPFTLYTVYNVHCTLCIMYIVHNSAKCTVHSMQCVGQNPNATVIVLQYNNTFSWQYTVYGRTCLDGYLIKKLGIFSLLYVHIGDYSTTFEVC